MNAPVTALDQRYGDPAATAIGWQETRRALEAAELSWIPKFAHAKGDPFGATTHRFAGAS